MKEPYENSTTDNIVDDVGWVNRHQQDVIEFLKTENKILREKLGRKRILLNDEQRKKLAMLGKRLGRKVLRMMSLV